MSFNKNLFILFLLVLFLCFGCVSASDIDDVNVTSISDESSIEIMEDVNHPDENNLVDSSTHQISSQNSLQSSDEEEVIVVNNWDELEYYCSLTDKDYTLKLKENTNFYPTRQITIYNNVRIIGSEGSYIGDSAYHTLVFNETTYSYEGPRISYTPIVIPDNSRIGITLENMTFKWFNILNYHPDAIFIQMGGGRNSKNVLKNCVFYDINMRGGHSCIVYLKKGDALLENCSFINCTTDFGCVSLYDPNSYTTARMTVKDCYFENNFARTEPGCINNCAILTVYNTTFYNNRAVNWAGAIHTHFYASATIYDSNFTDNVAGWNGGALYTYSDLKIYNTVFVGNNCTTNNGGGAIGACKFTSAPHIYIENSLFENNENLCWDLGANINGRGGAISLMDEGSLEVRNTTFISNAAYIGTAICAIVQESYGSPDVIIVNNSFINHTRRGDVLNIKVDGTACNISDNFYLGNSIEFSNLTLTVLNVGDEQSTLQIALNLTNPSYYDSDILNRTLYDVYINNEHVKTVNSTIFTLDFGNWDIFNVYVIPTISNRKTNEVTVTSTREYVFVSKNGSDDNNGKSRDAPVKTIKKALELAKNCKNILVLDGNYSENLEINYDVTLKGEGNVTLTDKMSFNVNNANFTLKNININNLNSNYFINQQNNNLIIDNCIFENNNVSSLFEANSVKITNSIIKNNNGLIINTTGFATITNSILLNNTVLISENADYNLDYNWWGNTLENYNVTPFDKVNNWLVLNASSNVNCLEVNQVALVNYGFNLFENNTVSKYGSLRNIELSITPVNGTSLNSTFTNSIIEYTLTSLNNGKLIAEYNNIITTVNFEFIKTNPDINVQTTNIMVGDDLIVKVNLPKDITGNLTINVDDIYQNKIIDSNNLVFTFKNIKANEYIVNVIYFGDDKYFSKEINTSMTVFKYDSTTNLDVGIIDVGKDVVLTINTLNDAMGNITLKINNYAETLILKNSKTNYTIKNITRGDYVITAIYNGDEKYLPSSDSKFIEVDNLNATLNAVIDDIVYGQTALIQITLNNDATGNVSVSVDGITNSSTVQNGKVNITFNNLEAGLKKAIIFYTGDNTYFNKTLNSNFTINKAELTFNISSSDIKIGQDAVIHIKVPAKTSGTFTIDDDVITIPLSGIVEYIIYDLELGEYELTAVYNGNNYYTVSNSTSFKVLEYATPQWQNDGFNSENTGKSPYESNTNGEIHWFSLLDDEIVGNLVIDSEGNIYFATDSNVYSLDNEGNLRWKFTSGSLEGNFSGLCIGRDVIIAPSAGDTLYFINQTDGFKYGSSNLYQGSSLFAPTIDSNANLYMLSEYQYDSNSYKLVKIPYKSWKYGGEIKYIDLGNMRPLTSPVVNDDIIVVLSEGRLRVMDAKTLQSKFIKSGDYANIKPVIGEGNIIYAVLGNYIVAYSSAGSQLWKTKVTGGVGKELVLDSESGLYSINSKGNLYKYDLITGTQSLVSNLQITSGILVGNDGNLYFASNNIFYELDSTGDILWKSILESNITGSPVMDENGSIYVPTENGITALTYASLKEPDLRIKVEDIVEGETATVTVTWNSQVTGTIICNVNGEEITANADDGKITKTISRLDIGYYDVEASYSGDMRFQPTTVTKTFVVRSTDDVANNIQFDGNRTFSFILNNAEGNLTVNVNDKTFSKGLVNGKASITVDNLAPGEYEAIATYSGDGIYSSASRMFTVSVPKFNITLNERITTENIVSTVSVTLPNDTEGNLTLSFGTKKYTEKVINGKAIIVVDDMPEGNYTPTLAYSGDSKYNDISKTISINLTRIPVALDDSNVFVKLGSEPEISVRLDFNATGNFVVDVDNGQYSADISDVIVISDLEPGNYTGTVTYNGDGRYDKASYTIHIEVPKIIIKLTDSNVIVNGNIISIKLNADATGNLTVIANGKKFSEALERGSASVEITGFYPGNYSALVVYSGDGKYASTNKTVSFTAPKLTSSLDNLTVTSDSISIDFGNDATGTLTVNVNGKTYQANVIDGNANVSITDLAPGNYSATVTYSGDNNYLNASRTVSLEVPKIIVNIEDISVDAGRDLTKITVNLPEGATGIIAVQINGKTYSTDADEISSIDITDLTPGHYTATVTYSGDNNYTNASKTIDFEVPKTTLKFNESTLSFEKHDNNIKITIALPADATGDVIVFVKDKNYTKTLTDGQTVIEVNDLDKGNYEVLVNYTGDDNYASISKTIRFSVSMINVTLDDTTLFVDNLTVSIRLNSDAEGNLTVIVNNKEFKEALTNGSASLTVYGLSPGNYPATVVYSGDDKYSIANVTVSLTVPKIKSRLDNLVIKSGSISIDFENDATGTLTANINGKDYTAKVINGVTDINITGLSPGTYTATVTYSGDNNYTNASKTVTLEVPKIVIDFDDVTVDAGYDLTIISVNLPEDATGNVVVKVNGKEYSSNVIRGVANINVTDLTPGNYTATVIYSGDNNYTNASKTIGFEVPKVKTVLDNNTLEIDSTSESSSFSVNLPSDATGTLTVIVNNKTYSKDLVDGRASVDVDDLAPGNYNATVIYSGDGKYDSIVKSANVNVPKVETVLDNNTLTIDSTSESSSFSVNLPSDATGTLTVIVNNKTYSKDLVDGKASVDVDDLAPGMYNATVIYSGDGKYCSIVKSANVNVPKVETVLDNNTLTIDSTSESSSFSVNLPSDATGTLTVIVNNKTYSKELVGGSAEVSIDDLAPGMYNATVIYSGDGKYGSIVKSTSINVPKVETVLDDTTLSVDSNSSTYSISLPSDATGTLTVNVDGTDYTSQLVKGKATVTILQLSEGTHNITVSYSGDSKYEAIVKSSVVNVNKTDITNTTEDNTTVKADSTLTVNVEDVNVGDDAVVNVKASFESGSITVNVNGRDYDVVIRNGEASLTVSDLTAGNYTAVAAFSGDDNFNNASNSTGFRVLKVSVPITDETVTLPSDSTAYSISLPADATGTLTVTVDGENYTQTLGSGKATVNIPELTTGTHNITVTYSGDAKYSPITKSSVVTKESVIRLTGLNLNMLYTSGKYFKVRLTSDGAPLAGKTVKITINGKTYSKTTNKDGYASMKISLPPKTYNVKASYANTTITKKVVVKSVIQAKNVNAKKSAKTVKIRVTLKKVNGKYLKNKKVTLKFNKKTFKAKTNKKGVVTFTIKKNVYSKLKVGKKYTYKVSYGKDVVNKKITIKK